MLERELWWHDAVRLGNDQRSRPWRKDPRICADRRAGHDGMDLQRKPGSLSQAGLSDIGVLLLKTATGMERND